MGTRPPDAPASRLPSSMVSLHIFLPHPFFLFPLFYFMIPPRPSVTCAPRPPSSVSGRVSPRLPRKAIRSVKIAKKVTLFQSRLCQQVGADSPRRLSHRRKTRQCRAFQVSLALLTRPDPQNTAADILSAWTGLSGTSQIDRCPRRARIRDYNPGSCA
jgi:hypothetical protein